MSSPDIRRSKLKALINHRYDGIARRFALAVEKPEGQINDMLSDPPRKSFGEKVARQMEGKLGLPIGFFDGTDDHNQDTASAKAAERRAVYTLTPATIKQIVDIAAELPEAMQQQLLGQAKMLQAEHRMQMKNPGKRSAT